MAHFPQHTPALWEFTRGESDSHREWRQAVARSEADSELSRQQGVGVWWTEQRYVNQALPSQFTDPKTFDNFNFGYQMYARQPIQRPIQSLAEASDAVPPLRYNVKRIAIDRPFRNAVCAMRCCTKNFHAGNNHAISSNRIELPPIERNINKKNDYAVKSTSHDIGPTQNFADTSSSVCSASVAESASNFDGYCTNTSNNNACNNKNNSNNIRSHHNDKSNNLHNSYNIINLNTNNNSNFINPTDLSRTSLNFIGSGTIQNVFYPCVGSFCPKVSVETQSPNSFDKVKASHDKDFSTILTSPKPTDTCRYKKMKNDVVLKACPVYEQKPILNCPAPQQSVSSFVCRPSDPNIKFPADRWVDGRRTDRNIEENDRDVACRRIYRTSTENTPENAHLDSIDPLIVCNVKSKQPGYKPKPGYRTYKIIGGQQYREPPQENIIDNMVLPPHLQKFKEYQRRCPDFRRGRYDKSNGLYEMLLPSTVCSTVIYADLNPFRYARNTNRNNEPPPVADPPDCHSCQGINVI